MVTTMKIRPLAVMAALAVLAAWAGLPGSAPLVAQGFGSSVFVGENEVLVGEPASEREPGSVRVFRAGDWAEVQALYAPDAAVRDRFGAALANDGSRLFVGAPGAGAVHVFERAGTEWRHAAEIPSPGLEEFGRSLAAGGAHLLVAAADGSDGQDIVVAYRRTEGGEWEEEARLSPDSEPSGFGASVALDRNLALIGAPLTGEGGGAAYLFRFEAGAGWDRVVELGSEGGDAGRAFGSAVALAGGEALVGAAGQDRGLGAVHRFMRNADGGWQLTGMVQPDAPAPAAFGAALAVDGAVAWVGAPAAAGGNGVVYRLGRAGDGWAIEDAWEIEGEGRIQAGRVVAAGGGRAVAGLPADDFGAGSAMVRDVAAGTMVRLVSEQVGLPSILGGQIDCDEGLAEGFDCDRVDLLSFLPREELGAGRGARLNDVWGWTDPATGREYALVGRMDGTAFVDVTDPFNPSYLGNLPKTEGSRSNTWRDMKVFRDHMFVVADGAGQHGMQIFDLTRLRDVTEPREWEPTALYEDVASVHNVAINEATGFAYLVGSSGGGETCGGGSHIVDINDPLNPVFAGCFAHPNTGRRNTGNSHDTQCVSYHGPDEDYAGREICVNSNETALSIADVTDKSDPVAVARAEYPNVSYAHQGWFTEDHQYFFSNDEADEVNLSVEQTRTLVWDLRDLDDPLLVQEYFSPTRVTDHNLYVRGDRLYMSNNRAGLRVLDISDPENPAEAGSFDTTPWSEDSAGFDGTWSVYPYFESGTILLSSRREGLFLVKPRAERLVP
ncbi:choice-of-anchor B family protein [Candidatus Palauibacter sp.]|uniref:choice-of-anchor B family protein n=1 Tax=Candidatus Palauibacter sp. TaxID=3101350 RepID=UPI003CC6C716